MPSPSYLMKRNGVYYARIPVPAALQRDLQKKEIWKSLGVAKYQEACSIMRLTFLSSSSMGDSNAEQEAGAITNPSILKIVTEHIYQVTLFERGTQVRRHFADAFRDKGMLGDHYLQQYAETELAQDIEATRLQILSCDYTQANEILKEILTETNLLRLPPKDKEIASTMYESLLQAYLKGLEELQRVVLNKELVKISPYPIEPLNMKLSTLMQLKRKVPAAKELSALANIKPTKAKLAFGELIKQFNSSDENKDKSKGNKVKYATYQKLLIEILGESTDIVSLNREVVRNTLRPVLSTIPSRYRIRRPYKGMTANKIYESELKKPTDFPKLDVPSKNDYLEHLSALMRWAVRENYSVMDPTQGLMFKNTKKAKNSRDPISAESLNKLFSDEKLIAARKSKAKAHEFWIPIIALCTGMRLSEIALLALDNVKQDKGIWYFDLKEMQNRTLKTEVSVRKVPLPETLAAIGFLDFYKSVRKDPKANERLFPYCPIGEVKAGDPFSKSFSRKMKSIGIKTPKTSFHSMRHNFRDFIREANLEPRDNQIALSMTGWDADEVHEKYGSSNYSVSAAKRVMDKIPLAEIQLEHLLVKKNARTDN